MHTHINTQVHTYALRKDKFKPAHMLIYGIGKYTHTLVRARTHTHIHKQANTHQAHTYTRPGQVQTSAYGLVHTSGKYTRTSIKYLPTQQTRTHLEHGQFQASRHGCLELGPRCLSALIVADLQRAQGRMALHALEQKRCIHKSHTHQTQMLQSLVCFQRASHRRSAVVLCTVSCKEWQFWKTRNIKINF
jgi:hypothetical protein